MGVRGNKWSHLIVSAAPRSASYQPIRVCVRSMNLEAIEKAWTFDMDDKSDAVYVLPEPEKAVDQVKWLINQVRSERMRADDLAVTVKELSKQLDSMNAGLEERNAEQKRDAEVHQVWGITSERDRVLKLLQDAPIYLDADARDNTKLTLLKLEEKVRDGHE